MGFASLNPSYAKAGRFPPRPAMGQSPARDTSGRLRVSLPSRPTSRQTAMTPDELIRRYAVVHTKRRGRGRFPEGCVTLFDDPDQARAAADPDQHRYAAVVHGPTPSSEGLRLYYLIQWL